MAGRKSKSGGKDKAFQKLPFGEQRNLGWAEGKDLAAPPNPALHELRFLRSIPSGLSLLQTPLLRQKFSKSFLSVATKNEITFFF